MWIYIIRAPDNVDHSLSSISADRSLQGTEMSIMQTPRFETEGKNQIFHLK